MAQQTADLPSTARRTPALASVALTLLLVAVLGLVSAVTLAPRLVGAVPLAVPTESMQPALAQGDLVMVRPVEPEYLEVGDLVAFRPTPGSGRVVTHRLTGIVEERGEVVALQTQGDANPYPDEPITRDQLEGRVAYSVPFVGRAVQEPAGLVAVAVGGLALVGSAVLVLGGRGRGTGSRGSEPQVTW